MDPQIKFMLITAFGSFLQELVHWYDLKGKLHHQKYQKMIKSKGYWILILLMILSSSIACYILYYPKLADLPSIQLLIGAGFPVIFKKLVSSIENNKSTDLGEGVLHDYFK